MVFESAGVFDSNDNCRSIGVKQNFEGTDLWYFTVVGNEEEYERKELHFKLYDNETNNTYRIEETICFVDNITLGNPDEPILLSSFNKEENETEISVCNRLYQNYPNPFKNFTSISFALQHPSFVKLQIFNIKGELIKTLLESQKFSGRYFIDWNAKDVDSGIYFYKLSTEDKTFIKKMVILN